VMNAVPGHDHDNFYSSWKYSDKRGGFGWRFVLGRAVTVGECAAAYGSAAAVSVSVTS
jgi:hypothetical protein